MRKSPSPPVQNSSTGAAWPEAEASRVSRVTRERQFFGQHDVGRVIGRKVVTQLPNPGKEREVRISGQAEIQQIAHRFLSPA